jgi:hypothetical protein
MLTPQKHWLAGLLALKIIGVNSIKDLIAMADLAADKDGDVGWTAPDTSHELFTPALPLA